MSYIEQLQQAIADLGSETSWAELSGMLHKLNPVLHRTGLRASAERTDKGWLIEFSDAKAPVAAWRMSSQDPDIHAWPVEQLAGQLGMIGMGHEAQSVEDLAGAWLQYVSRS
jgi:hypothetical protein